MHPIIKMVGRMVSPHSVRHELYPAAQMLLDRYLYSSGNALEIEGHAEFERTVVFMPGLIARHGYYRRTSTYLAQQKVRFVPVRGLGRNVLPWDESSQAISDTVKKVEDETGNAPDLLVHSKGGTDSLRVLAEHEEIPQAIFVASPMRGQSFDALVSLFSIARQRPPCIEALEDPGICSRITTITSRVDEIVRVDEAQIKGARNIVVRPAKTEGQWESHTGLLYFARRHIVRCLKDHQALVAA